MGMVYQTWEGGHQTYTKDKKSTQSTELIYEGDDDVNAAAAAFFAWLPATVPDLFAAGGVLILERFGPVNRIAAGTFTCNAEYVDPEGDGAGGKGGQPNPCATGEFKIEWDFSPATQKVTFSEAGKFTKYLDPAYADPNPFGGIGIKKHDGKTTVDGVDIRVPAMKFSVQFKVPNATITTAYARALRDKELLRNSATFLGWKPKELLYVGGTGSQSVFGDPELKFDFETDIEVKKKFGNIPMVTKPPHDYLDIIYDTEADDTLKRLVGKPIAAYVHNFYGTTSFPALFGFGP